MLAPLGKINWSVRVLTPITAELIVIILAPFPSFYTSPAELGSLLALRISHTVRDHTCVGGWHGSNNNNDKVQLAEFL